VLRCSAEVVRKRSRGAAAQVKSEDAEVHVQRSRGEPGADIEVLMMAEVQMKSSSAESELHRRYGEAEVLKRCRGGADEVKRS
jgi:hypothetical protein